MKKLPLIISVSFLTALVACYFLIPAFQSFVKTAFAILTSDDQQRIGDWVRTFGFWGPVVLVLVMVLQMFLFVVPNILVMIVAIVSYGPIWGSVIAFIGVFASSSVGYLIGKKLGPVTVNKFISENARQKAADFIRRYGIVSIAITRLSSLSNDSLSIVAGLLKMAYHKYILATLAGITPLIVLLAIYGKNGKILNALIWIAGISLVVLIIYIIFNRKKPDAANVPRNDNKEMSS